MDYSDPLPAVSEDAVETGGFASLLALKDGDCFLVADEWGDLRGGADGLFDHDTRILSRLILTIGRARPSRLSSGVSGDDVYFTCHATNRPLPPMGHHAAPAGVLHIERRRFLHQDRLFERVRISNHGQEEVWAPVTYDFDVDFADIFEVRGALRPRHGQRRTPALDGRRVMFGYAGLDGVERSSCLAFSEPPARLSASHAEFMFSLPTKRRVDLYLECGRELCEAPDELRFRRNAVQARLAMRRRRRRGASVRGVGATGFNAWLAQSKADIALLTTDLATGPYPYAGIPWFSTPFGRDGIIAAWQTLWLEPSLAKGVLTYLAGRQAASSSAFQDSAPGKIMHETRGGEMSALGEVPFGLYYGGVDTTCLFVALAGAYARRTGDLETVRALWPHLLAAAGWMRVQMDEGRGFIAYQRAAETGLSNQGWKDSFDSISHADGSFPKGPIALLEVQGYAFAAWRALADLARLTGQDEGDARERAEAIRAGVEDRFWMEDEGFYAIALDGDGRQVRSIGSNAGHLLFTGLPSPDRARRVIDRLLSAEFRSGWGLRTLAMDQARYNPMSYHNGSVWPHDTAMAAAGMARYGARRAAARILNDLHAAANHFHMRLPELFCGFEREPGEGPIAYPVACLPQAWAAGAVFQMLQAALGLEADGLNNRLIVTNPVLPEGVDRLDIAGLGIGGSNARLSFRRIDGRTVVIGDGCARLFCNEAPEASPAHEQPAPS